MSHPRLIYPLLEGFFLGDAISAHDGARCYPAIRQKDGEKFIVKVISIPASRVQLDALLLAGAFSGKEGAMEYFKELAGEKASEVKILQQLSQQEGFVSYQGCQVVVNEDGNGYDVYLLGSFKQSLEQRFKANDMTHRGVVDLGLDLCAALAACRRAGYLYLDLKPGNIFYTEDLGHRIGDLGFASLASLRYSGMPTGLRSAYTPPEVLGELAVLNETVDIYALGMVLYQACNGGVLPEDKDVTVPPLYADYELAKILLKACHPDPQQRWQDPTAFAQALIGYMQQVGVSDASMIPAPIEDPQDETEDFLPEATAEELAEEMAGLIPEDILMEAMAPMDGEEATEEDLQEMLAQADELIAHEAPEPAVAPEPLPIVMPELLPEEPEAEPEITPEPEPEPEPNVEETPEEIPEEAEQKEESPAPLPPKEKEEKVRKPFPWKILLVLALAALVVFGCVKASDYYSNVYIQSVDTLDVQLDEGMLIVKVGTTADETLLRVSCADTYGNVRYSDVAAGIAMFTDLQPNTRYTIRVLINGNHKLTGNTTASITTPEQTEILTFTACIGDQDGSALLTLTSRGPTVETWTLTYSTPGQEAVTTTFTGNAVQVEGLSSGCEYTFTLSVTGQTIGGNTQVRFTASDIILAENLAITACGGGKLTAQWTSPEGYVAINGWAVRCYDSGGYDQSVITYEPWFTFVGMDHSSECTVEVTAVGMYQSVRTTIGADPITVERFDFSVSMNAGMMVTWTFTGSAPEGGWVVEYDIDGLTRTLTVPDNHVHVESLPGVTYRFTVQPADGRDMFGGSGEFSLTEVGSFSGYGIPADSLRAQFTSSTLTLTAPEDCQIEATEAAVSILYLLHSAEGKLIAALETDAIWNQLWEGNVCTLEVPNIPATPGEYHLSVYINGGWVTDLTFFVE